MKASDRQKRTVTGPMLSDLVNRHKANQKALLEEPQVESTPLDPPDLYQDAGNGYNADFTFPQE
jgi:hypothetical protein